MLNPSNRADMTRAEKAAFVREYGTQAYLGLPMGKPRTAPSGRAEMTTPEKAAYVSEHGKDKYLELPYHPATK